MANEKKNLWIILIIAAFVVGIGGGIGLGALLGTSSGGGKGSVNLYPPTASQARGKWLAKIDNYVITKAEFEEGVEFLLSQMPEEQKAQFPDTASLKRQYLDTLIGQYAVMIDAMEKGLLQKKETKLLTMAAIRDAVYKVYLNEQISDPTMFYPSKVEEEQFFKQYRAQLIQMGYTAAQMKQVAQQQLAQQKMQMWQQQFVTGVRDNYKIQKNTELLDKEGLGETSAPQGLNLPQGMVAPQQ